LIELLVVIAIIGILAAFATFSFAKARAKARDERRKSDIKTIQTALELYYEKNGQYPNTGYNFDTDRGTINADPGCTKINTREAGSGDNPGAWIPELVNEGFLTNVPKDPKPQPRNNATHNIGAACYMYASDGTRYVLSAHNTVETEELKPGDDFYTKEGFIIGADQKSVCDNTNYGNYRKYSYTVTNVICQ